MVLIWKKTKGVIGWRSTQFDSSYVATFFIFSHAKSSIKGDIKSYTE